MYLNVSFCIFQTGFKRYKKIQKDTCIFYFFQKIHVSFKIFQKIHVSFKIFSKETCIFVAGATRVENKSLQRGTTKMLRAPTLKQWHPVPPNLVHFSIRRPRLFPTCVTLSQGPMQVTTSNLCSWLRCLADHALNVWMEHIQGFIGFSHWSIFSVECVSGFVTGCRWMCLWLHI